MHVPNARFNASQNMIPVESCPIFEQLREGRGVFLECKASNPIIFDNVLTGSWFNGDVKELIDEALATGGDPNISDAFTINGWPGALYNCSNGISLYTHIY